MDDSLAGCGVDRLDRLADIIGIAGVESMLDPALDLTAHRLVALAGLLVGDIALLLALNVRHWASLFVGFVDSISSPDETSSGSVSMLPPFGGLPQR